jgi:hypothetical protein
MSKKKADVVKMTCVNADTCIHVGDDCSDEGGKGREYACFGEAPESSEPITSDSDKTEEADGPIEDNPSICTNSTCAMHNPEENNGCTTFEHAHECDDVIFAACTGIGFTAEKEVEKPEVADEQPPVEATTAINGADIPVTAYVHKDPDFISPPFTRSLPVPVPDEELADLAKKMSHTHGVWCKAKLDAKAAAKAFKGVTDRAEEEMVQLAGIIEEGTEERPVSCRWEFDYTAAIKKLRRLDNHQIVCEEILKGEELNMSFNFNGSSEANAEKLRAEQLKGVEDGTASPETKTLETSETQTKIPETEDTPGATDTGGKESVMPDPELPVGEEHANIPVTKPKEGDPGYVMPSGFGCKLCGFDGGSHIYLVRHLRDVHSMKLSDYKQQFPA